MKILFICLLLINMLSCTQSTKYPASGSESGSRSSQGQQLSKTLTDVEIQFLEKSLLQKKLHLNHIHILLRAFKHEKKLELWVKETSDASFSYLKNWNFCASSGDLGPKRKEGDKQIPEGLYHIDRFNPHSKYFLSLGLNYPNESDRIRGHAEYPGSDIFIHGDCKTIGCIPITDLLIRELYHIAEQAKSNGQTHIPLMIFPFRMTADNMAAFSSRYEKHKNFWRELRVFYDYFTETKEMPAYFIAPDGTYSLRE